MAPSIAKKRKAWLGADPGAKGALCYITEAGRIHFIDWKDEKHMGEMLDMIASTYDIQLCVLEKVSSMPGQGVKSMFSMGRNLGMWMALLRNIPYVMLAPITWRKGIVTKSDGADPKKAVKNVCKRMFPTYDNKLYGPRGGYKDGRGDALLLAYVAKQKG